MSHKNFESILYQWFNEQMECDVKFSCPNDLNDCSGKSTIGAHKMILSMSSDVFFAMFYGPMSPTNDAAATNVIDIPDIKFSTFKTLLSFIYIKGIQFETVELASEFYYAAEKYNCKDALKFVTTYMVKGMNPKNCIYIYETNYLFNNYELKHFCLKTFSAACDEILVIEEFLSADPKTVETIFGLEVLSIQSEMDLVKALERYIEHNKSIDADIVAKVRPALCYIRFLTLRWKDVVETSLLTADEKVEVGACLLSPLEDLSKMPKGLSICTKKRHFVKAVRQMIRELSDVYSSKTCFHCVSSKHNSSDHAIWNCEFLAGTHPSKVLALIYQKYNHTSLLEYDRCDLKAIYDMFKRVSLIK